MEPNGRLPAQGFTPDKYMVWWDMSALEDDCATASSCGTSAPSRHRGKVRIFGTYAACASRELYLHAACDTLTIVQASSIHHKAPAAVALRVRHHRDVLCLTAPADLPPGPMYLDLDFVWVVSSTPAGLYMGRRSGQAAPATPPSPPYLVTQFEPCAARRAFPCIDEPDAKARFAIRVKPPSMEWLVLSNMPRAIPVPDSDGFLCFQTTPLMSTYLVALVVAAPGTFVCSHSHAMSNGTLVRVWRDAVQDLPAAADEALATAIKALQALTHLTGADYSLPKLDLVPVHDFDSGAMENWGLLVFRRTALLTPPGRPDQVREVVAHEIAHQWFGNRITMRWWHHLWLNEAFATLCATWVCALWDLGFTEYTDQAWAAALDSNVPSWRTFLQQDLPPVLHSRAVRTARDSVVTGVDIEAQFDGATYVKGAAILRGMLLALDDAGPRCLRAYFACAEAAGGVSNPAMLWDALRPEAPQVVTLGSAALDWGADVDSLPSNPNFAWPCLVALQRPCCTDTLLTRVRLAARAGDFGQALCLVFSACDAVHNHGDPAALALIKQVASAGPGEDPALVAVAQKQLAAWRLQCRHSPTGMTDAGKRATLQVMAARGKQGKFALRALLATALRSIQPDADVEAWQALLQGLRASGLLSEREAVDAVLDVQRRAAAASTVCSAVLSAVSEEQESEW